MTTVRQSRANLMNAMKSTGPRSPEGKKRSSANARRHGLASKAGEEETGKWLEIVLGCSPEDLEMPRDEERFYAALQLAEAEATLEKALIYEEFHELDRYMGGPVRPPIEDDTVDEIIEEMEREFFTRALTPEDWGLMTGTLRMIRAVRRKRELDSERRLRLSRRYRREAEGARRRALDRWIRVQNPETKPITSLS